MKNKADVAQLVFRAFQGILLASVGAHNVGAQRTAVQQERASGAQGGLSVSRKRSAQRAGFTRSKERERSARRCESEVEAMAVSGGRSR